MLDRAQASLWAVADGMGGHRDGALAAQRLVEDLASLDAEPSGYRRMQEAVRRVEALNASLFAQRAERGPVGSTLVLLLAHEGHYACLWAGDSRAYLLREGRLSPITRDHSLVQDLVDQGVIADDQRRRHPAAHVITRAVGASATLELERCFAPIAAGDVFLLCSDGLTGCVGEDRIAAEMAAGDLEGSADRLVSAALAAGAPDNVSLVLARADEAAQATGG